MGGGGGWRGGGGEGGKPYLASGLWLVYLASYSLEHVVCSNIMAHLDRYKLLSDRQHAFRKGHSCETQFTTVINDWAKIMDNRGQVDTIILDFEKQLIHPLTNSLNANF